MDAQDLMYSKICVLVSQKSSKWLHAEAIWKRHILV